MVPRFVLRPGEPAVGGESVAAAEVEGAVSRLPARFERSCGSG